jgi:signal transduction histidine kinase
MVSPHAGEAELQPDDGLPEPPRFRIPDRAIDVAIILTLGFVYAGAAAVSLIHGVGDDPKPYLVSLVLLPALWWRRRWPFQVLGLLLVVSIYAYPLVPAVLVAMYCVACRSRTLVALTAGLVTASVLLLGLLIRGGETGLGSVTSVLASVGTATALGLYLGTRRGYVSALRGRALDLQRERDLMAANAVAEERIRIARELHDVVAHHVSIMVVQAGALGETSPDEHSKQIAGNIAATGRTALTEMRRILGVLRGGIANDQEAFEPQPGVADIARLVHETSAAGVHAELVVEGQPRPLPPGIDLTAYRITQEALTNVIRHAGATTANVTMRYEATQVELTIVDDGKGASSTERSEGNGLVGMRERVGMLGGKLSTGTRPEGGFEVRAVLPVGEVERA